MEFELTSDQKEAYRAFLAFMLDQEEDEFVLTGFAGTGKTTLVNKLLSELEKILKTINLTAPKGEEVRYKATYLTATTNKAAEQLRTTVGSTVSTIHSLLGLKVVKNYKKNETHLEANGEVIHDAIIFIDEASYIDMQLLRMIRENTVDCKIIYIGDPAQLAPVGYTRTPVFELDVPTAQLEEVVRQAKDNPIQDLATALREVVRGADYPVLTLCTHVRSVSGEEWYHEIQKEFLQPDWHHGTSRILAWRNKSVIHYNRFINKHKHGTAELCEGDYVVNNNYVTGPGGAFLRTDQETQIEKIEPAQMVYTINGISYVVDGFKVKTIDGLQAFMPGDFDDKREMMKIARKNQAWNVCRALDQWVDLRHAYASTVFKAQGSTFDRVFIDLPDIDGCNQANTVARMLYVAVTRARYEVIIKEA